MVMWIFLLATMMAWRCIKTMPQTAGPLKINHRKHLNLKLTFLEKIFRSVGLLAFVISDSETFGFAASQSGAINDGTTTKNGHSYFVGDDCCSIFINHYDAQKKLVWTKVIPAHNTNAVAIRTDSNGNIYVAGTN